VGFPGARPKIGDPGIERVVRLGLRKDGVTIPEVMEEFGVGKDCARRFVLRLIREGRLMRTDRRRRRPDVFIRHHGAGGVIYQATQAERARLARGTHTRYAAAYRSRKRRNYGQAG